MKPIIGQRENKKQHGIFKYSHINNHITGKCSTHLNRDSHIEIKNLSPSTCCLWETYFNYKNTLG